MSRTYKDSPYRAQIIRGVRVPKRRERYDNTVYGDGSVETRRPRNNYVDHNHDKIGYVVTHRRYLRDENGESIDHFIDSRKTKEIEDICRSYQERGIRYVKREPWGFDYTLIRPYVLVDVDEYADRCTANEELVTDVKNFHRLRTVDGKLAPCEPDHVDPLKGSWWRYYYESSHRDCLRAMDQVNRARLTANARKAVKSYADGEVDDDYADALTYDLSPGGWCC